MNTYIKSIAVITALLISSTVLADGGTAVAGGKAKTEDWKEEFGLSLGAGAIIPNRKNITDATISNGIVRVTGEQQVIPSFWLTTHWTYRPTAFTGVGPFVGLGLNTDQGLFSSMAAGVMLSLTRTKWEERGKRQPAFNIGLGYGVQKIKVLGNGIKEDSYLPENEEAIRYKDRYTHGPVLLFSFSVF